MLALFIASAFYDINYSLGIMAVTLYLGAVGGTEKEQYRHLYECVSETKLKNHPMELKRVTVHWELKLISCFRRIKPDCICEFIVVNDEMQKIKELSEKELLNLMASVPHGTSVREALGF